MGMSSSQARLLNLTARMHQIEYKAAKLEAQKLQMANESRRVYDNYLQALDAKKVQFLTLNSKGGADYKNATLAKFQNGVVDGYTGESSQKTYLVQNSYDGKIYVTEDFANKFGITETEDIELGTLAQYLEAHDVHKQEIMEGGRDYSIFHATLGSLDAPSAVDHTPGYVLNGSISAPVDTSTTTNITKDIVVAGNYAEDAVSNIGKVHTNEVYQYLSTCNPTYTAQPSTITYTFDRLDRKIDGDVRHSGSSGIYPYITNRTMTSSFSFETETRQLGFGYNGTTTLKDYLIFLAAQDENIIFDEASKTLTLTNYTTIAHNNEVDRDTRPEAPFNPGYATTSGGGEVAFNLDTKISDYVKATDTGFELKINNTAVGYTGSSDIQELTIGQYLEWVKTESDYADDGFDYWMKDGKIQMSIAESASSAFFNMNNATSSVAAECKDNRETNQIQLNLTAIAENLYLADIIGNGLSVAEYNSSRNAGMVDAYKNQLDSITDLKILAAISDDLTEALQNPGEGNANINNVRNKIHSYLNNLYRGFSYRSTNINKYDEVSTTDADKNKTTTAYTFTKTESPVSFTPSTSTIITGTETTYKANSCSKNDIIKQLAYDMYNKNHELGNPNDIATGLATKFASYGYTNEDVASISTFYGKSEWNTIVNALVNNNRVDSYTNALDGYTVTMAAANNVSITKVGVEEHYVTADSRNDIASMLSMSMYNKNNDVNPISAKNTILSTFSNAQLASLSSYYGTAEWTNIVNSLISSISVASVQSYTTKYDSYSDIRMSATDNISITEEPPVEPHGTGEYEIIQDDYYTTLVNEYNMLEKLQGKKFVIVDDEQANSEEFLSNLLTNNDAYLLEFNNDIENFTSTDVSVETSLQEVSDETMLRKAEAQYEADMRKIDRKDRMYDTELAALDNERNAIKSEMETLKTVAKDNVERTFKLFG